MEKQGSGVNSGSGRARLFQSCLALTTLWMLAHQAPLSRGFSRQEYWSGLPFLSPGDFPYPGIKPRSLMTLALADRFFTTSTTWEGPILVDRCKGKAQLN